MRHPRPRLRRSFLANPGVEAYHDFGVESFNHVYALLARDWEGLASLGVEGVATRPEPNAETAVHVGTESCDCTATLVPHGHPRLVRLIGAQIFEGSARDTWGRAGRPATISTNGPG
jgi:hypothetical protein